MRFTIGIFLIGLAAASPVATNLEPRADCPADAYGPLCPGDAPAGALCCYNGQFGKCDSGKIYNVCLGLTWPTGK